MKKFAVGVVLLAALGAACAKAGSDGPVPDADENAMKAASAAAAESYVSSLEQSAGSVVGIGATQQKAALAAAGESYVSSLGDLRPGPLSVGATAITAPETFTIEGTVTAEKVVDVGKPRFSPGDSYLIREQLKNEAGDVVGTGVIQCTQHIPPWTICTGAFNITDRGEIVGTGMVKFTEEETPLFNVPINGGTGDFSNARGQVQVQGTETGDTLTFQLLP
jgi:hypothetical protein